MAKKKEKASKRRMPVREVTAELNGTYDGWSVSGRGNIPPGLALDVQRAWADFYEVLQEVQEDPERRQKRPYLGELEQDLFEAQWAYLDAILVPHGKWNFVDTEGKKMPVTKEAIRSLPADLLHLTRIELAGAISELPFL
jgi:hypothetical protein